ncbi:hypothetical protein D3C87_2188490 [compost metagenome]
MHFFTPALDPLRRLAEHPFTNVDDQAARFGQRDELQRADHAALRMLPADQRFGLVDLAGL